MENTNNSRSYLLFFFRIIIFQQEGILINLNHHIYIFIILFKLDNIIYLEKFNIFDIYIYIYLIYIFFLSIYSIKYTTIINIINTIANLIKYNSYHGSSVTDVCAVLFLSQTLWRFFRQIGCGSYVVHVLLQTHAPPCD